MRQISRRHEKTTGGSTEVFPIGPNRESQLSSATSPPSVAP